MAVAVTALKNRGVVYYVCAGILCVFVYDAAETVGLLPPDGQLSGVHKCSGHLLASFMLLGTMEPFRQNVSWSGHGFP